MLVTGGVVTFGHKQIVRLLADAEPPKQISTSSLDRTRDKAYLSCLIQLGPSRIGVNPQT